MSVQTHTHRLIRRETHSSRAVASVITAVIVIIVVAWLGTETVLSMTGKKPLLVSPPQMGQWLTAVPQATVPAALIAAGVVLILIGVFFLILALRAGNLRGRHTVSSDRNAVVVDDEVIAAAISATTRRTAALAPEQVTTGISRRRIDVLIHPTSGTTVDENAVRAAVEGDLAGYALVPEPKVNITISQRGALGV